MNYLFTIFFMALLVSCHTKADTTKNSSSAQATTETHQKSFENIDVALAKKIKGEQPNVIFLDVRTAEEIADGKIDDALEIDFRSNDFQNKVKELDPSKEYVVYCKSGGRSAKASQLMIDNGFTSVKNLKGGYQAYKQ